MAQFDGSILGQKVLSKIDQILNEKENDFGSRSSSTFYVIIESCSRREGGDCYDDVMIRCAQAVTAMSINPMLPYHLAVGSSDSSVRIFDRRMLSVGRGLNGGGKGGSRWVVVYRLMKK